VSLKVQRPLAVLGPLALRLTTQTVVPPFFTATDPVGDPVVPDATVAEMSAELSSPKAAEDGDTLKVVELVAGKTERGTVVESAVKLASPG
jgi:hypothetical protein